VERYSWKPPLTASLQRDAHNTIKDHTMRLIDDVLWFAVGFLVIVLIAVNVLL